jgi:predicted O-methyltransferase YrrM
MDKHVFGAVERFVGERFAPEDPALAGALQAASEAGLPDIHISAAQAKLLQILAAAVGARRILEIGTLAGYSTIWLARGLPAGGSLITLEIDAQRAEIARSNLSRARLDDVVELRVGPAIDSLRRMVGDSEAPFDLVFVDADEASYSDYLEAVLALTRAGSFIVFDNIVREGAILDESTPDPRASAARRFLDALAADDRVTATVVPIAGEGSYDGMAIALVLPVD